MNLGVIVLTGLTVVLMFPGKPFILKLTPKTPSPTLFPTSMLPIIGIFETSLFKVLAGTNVPLRLINPVFFSIYPFMCKDTLVPKASTSSTIVTLELSLRLISKKSKLIPCPDKRSAIPPRSAKVSKVAKTGALITLKFSIVSFEIEFFSSIVELYRSFPSLTPSKNL